MNTNLDPRAHRSAIKITRWSALVCMLLLSPMHPTLTAQTKAPTSVNRSSFAGTWRGLCDDGKPFVLLTLSPTSNQIEGTISLGNVKFGSSTVSNSNTCTVADPADAAHATTIKNAALDGSRLTFEYSQGQQIEVDLTHPGTAKLRFLGTPYEETSFVINKTSN
jgi:hypothetical protein